MLFAKRPEPGSPSGIIFALLLSYPASRGSVHIKSADVREHPAVDPGYLTHPADTAVIAAGLRFIDKASKSPHLASSLVERTWPAPDLDMTKPEVSRKAVEDVVMGTYHPIGSCAMGDVVDGSLKVKGVKGLRVVDASVFPNHVSGNICSSVYAVAENAADIIKSDYGMKSGA